MPPKIADLIDGLSFFKDFRYPELETVSRYFSRLSLAKGAVLFNEGDPGDSLFVLVKGRMAIVKASDQGPQILCHESGGRTIGEMALLDHEKRSATCLAEDDCELLSLDQAALERMAREVPGLAYRFMYCMAQQLSRRLRRTSGELADR